MSIFGGPPVLFDNDDAALTAILNAQRPSTIDSTLAERGSRYGSFVGHALVSQDLKAAMVRTPRWCELPADMKESLEMIQHKIARVLNGDPNYVDSWHDIIGYARLIEKRLEGDKE